MLTKLCDCGGAVEATLADDCDQFLPGGGDRGHAEGDGPIIKCFVPIVEFILACARGEIVHGPLMMRLLLSMTIRPRYTQQ